MPMSADFVRRTQPEALGTYKKKTSGKAHFQRFSAIHVLAGGGLLFRRQIDGGVRRRAPKQQVMQQIMDNDKRPTNTE
jgi:hypothetical protein